MTGFIVEDEEQAVAAVHRLGQLDRRKIRSRFEERFSATEWLKSTKANTEDVMTAASERARFDFNLRNMKGLRKCRSLKRGGETR